MIPKVGDTVLVVPLRMRGRAGKKLTVTKIGKKYFYAGETAFEIDSYSNGSWLDKETGYGSMHDCLAYVSQDIYEKLLLKQKQIEEIEGSEKKNWSCAKVSAVLNFINSFGDMDESEDWE